MANAPSPPWNYRCPFPDCGFYIVVNARGQRGNDPGSGVEAALRMREHALIHATVSVPVSVRPEGEQT